MRKTILALVLAGTAMPLAAQTPTPTPPPAGGPMMGGMLMRADANGDGVVTRDEATAAADTRFDRLDANHDGTVTADEMRAARDAMQGGNGGPPPPPRRRPAAAGSAPDGDGDDARAVAHAGAGDVRPCRCQP